MEKDNMYYYEIMRSVYEWCRSNRFMGYDPYDFGTSKISHFLKNIPFGNKINVLLTQIFRYSPINFRSVLGIHKNINVNALVHIGKSILQANKDKDNFYIGDIETLKFILNTIYNYKIVVKDTFAWGRVDYDFFNTSGIQHRNKPIVFLTSIVGELYLEAYKRLKYKPFLEISEKSAKYLLLYADRCEAGNCLYYIEGLKNMIFNANAIASRFLSKIYVYTNNEKYLNFSRELMEWVVQNQNENGSWYYGYSEGGHLLSLVDFHQGFILDSLMEYIQYTKHYSKKFINALENGIYFYRYHLFDEKGRSIYRWPKWKYPVDIHNQAQGIITFSLYGHFTGENEWFNFAKRIIDWTIVHMWNDKGKYFYNYYTPIVKNKIPYIRWNQAWMLYALATYLQLSNGGVLVEENHSG